MGRPKIGPRVCVRMRREVWAEVLRWAAEHGMTPSAAARELIERGLAARLVVTRGGGGDGT